ncbi:MAG: hypothetical protein WC988_00760 [Patescibacteria group bacterium]
MEYSLIVAPDLKEAIKTNINDITDTELSGLGTLLALEHKHRDKLDATMVTTFFETLEKYKPQEAK